MRRKSLLRPLLFSATEIVPLGEIATVNTSPITCPPSCFFLIQVPTKSPLVNGADERGLGACTCVDAGTGATTPFAAVARMGIANTNAQRPARTSPTL